MPAVTASQLDFLKSIDTPTACNLIEVVAPERRGFGYTVKHLHCPFPDHRRQVGKRAMKMLDGIAEAAPLGCDDLDQIARRRGVDRFQEIQLARCHGRHALPLSSFAA